MTRSAVVLLGLTLALSGCKSKTDPAPARAATPDFTVKAGDLLKEYEANAISADTKYKGKTVKLTGNFAKVQKIPLMGYVVTLQGEGAEAGDLSGIQCAVEESAKDEFGSFKPGQAIAVQGLCDGQVIGGQIKFSKCVVAK